MAPRLYLAPQDSARNDAPDAVWEKGAMITLSPAHARYLGSVLRLGEGDAVRVFDGVSGEWEAAIGGLRKERGLLRLMGQSRPQASLRDVTLFFAPLKRDATDLVVRMGTELGVTTFAPVVTARTNTHRVNTDRLRAIAIEAAEQSERLDIPRIADLSPLSSALAAWPAGHALFVALERMTGDVPPVLSRPHGAPYGVLLGPEGGFAPEERRWLAAFPGLHAFSLGPLVLRADTAACAALAVLAAAQDSSTLIET